VTVAFHDPIRMKHHQNLVATLAGLGLASASALAGPPAGYRDSAAIAKALADAATAATGRPVAVSSIGRSAGGRDLPLVTIGTPAPGRPAVLVVAGLDGSHLIGSEIAAELVAKLVADEKLPADAVIYLVPRLNPDAADATLASPLVQSSTTVPVDDDRDGTADEDGPRDLNGDGAITQMRIADPKPPLVATHVADPAEPRLLRVADPLKGETPMYAVLVEGVDADLDGRIAEDGPGGTTLDRNFPHRWPEFAADAGRFPLSAPESLAFATFVRDRRDIAAAIVLGRHDNSVNFPDTRDMDSTGRTPMVFLGDDQPFHRDLATLAKDTTGQARAAGLDHAGSCWLWLNDHRGIPTVALTAWGRPDPSKPAEAPKEGDAKEGEPKAGESDPPKPAEPSPSASPPPEASPPAPGGDASAARGGGRRGGRGGFGPGGGPGGGRPGAAPAASAAKPVVDEELLRWLEVNDRDRNGELFVPWQEIDHLQTPSLGSKVEVGGFRTLLQVNPPHGEIDGLAAKQAALVRELVLRLPRLTVETATVTPLADGLYRVELPVRNAGRMPTATNMGRITQKVDPVLVQVSVPVEQVIGGDRIVRIDRIDAGERQVIGWIVRAVQDEPLEVTVTGPAGFRHSQRFVNGQPAAAEGASR
jgi:hypothetical protein